MSAMAMHMAHMSPSRLCGFNSGLQFLILHTQVLRSKNVIYTLFPTNCLYIFSLTIPVTVHSGCTIKRQHHADNSCIRNVQGHFLTLAKCEILLNDLRLNILHAMDLESMLAILFQSAYSYYLSFLSPITVCPEDIIFFSTMPPIQEWHGIMVAIYPCIVCNIHLKLRIVNFVPTGTGS